MAAPFPGGKLRRFSMKFSSRKSSSLWTAVITAWFLTWLPANAGAM
jgi:hypothetical protein